MSSLVVKRITGAPPQPQKLSPQAKLPNTAVFEVPAVGSRQWTPPDVRNAIIESSQGRLQLLGDLARLMETDEAYAAAMQRRVNGLIRSPMRVIPSDINNTDSVKVAMLVEKHLEHMIPLLELRRYVSWYHQLDNSIATLDWSVDDDVDLWMPRLRCLNPRWMYFDVSRNVWVHTSYDGMHDVMPGDGRWVQSTDWMYGKPAGKASSLGNVWVAKQFAFRDWQQWSDFYAWPIIKAMFPNGGSETPEEKTEYVTAVKNMVTQRVVGLPQGPDANNSYDIDVVKTSGEEYQGFVSRIEYADRKYQIGWLGGNLSSEIAAGGSYSAAQTHDGVEKDLLAGDAQVISETLTEQVIRCFVVANFGDDRLTPTLEWTILDEDDAASKAKGILDFANALSTLSAAGFEVANLEDVAEDFGLQLRPKKTP